MKIITQLTGTASEGPYTESRGVLQTVHNEPVQGFFRRITLGSAGVVITQPRGASVAIPLDALLKLAEQHCEALRPPVPAAVVEMNRTPLSKIAGEISKTIQRKTVPKKN